MNYTKEMCDFIRYNCTEYTIKELYALFIEKFQCNASIHGLRAKIKAMGLTFKRHEYYGSQLFSKEVVQYIRYNANGLVNEVLAKQVAEKFSIEITKDDVKRIKAVNKITSGLSPFEAMMMNRPKDWVNPQKGKKLSPERYEKIKHAFFKKGFNGFPPCPVGTERLRDGRYYIKIEEPDKWIPKATYVYEKYTGDKVEKSEAVILLDGSTDNFNLDNLLKVARADILRYNQMKIGHRNDSEFTKAVFLMQKLARVKRERERNNEKK